MGVEQSSKRSHDQIDADIETGESLLQSSDNPHIHISTENKAEESTLVGQQPPHEPTNSESEVAGSPKQATSGYRDQVESVSKVGTASKRPCLEERRHFDFRDYLQRKVSPHAATHRSPTPESTLSKYSDGSSVSKAIHEPKLDSNPRRSLNKKSRLISQQNDSPSKSSQHNLKPSESNPPRPVFNQLATDGQQGMKVLFLIDHATKGDAVHHNLKPFFTPPSSSSEMKLLMSKLYSGRSHFQNQYFAKARTICAQLTSRRQFTELETETEELLSSGRARRLAYFSEKCSKVYLATLYSHLASAVDIPKILLARTPNDKAFKNLMTQVFIHSMEDLWCYEFHSSKQDLSAKREKENKDDVYNRFRILTDREDGLPAVKDLPGYLEVPLTAKFPRYVLFGQGVGPGDGEDVDGSDNVGGDEDKGGDISHAWISAEVRFRDNGLTSNVY